MRNGFVGRGECLPYARYGETIETVSAQINSVAANGLVSRHQLLEMLPAGAARNAIDAALWDLEAKIAGRPVWQLAGLSEPAPVQTASTLSLGTPEAMRAAAARQSSCRLLKVKLGGGEADVRRIEAVRQGAPEAKIIVDANEGWSVDEYVKLAPLFSRLGVAVVEQPFPAGDDAALSEIDRRLPVCADESCHDSVSLEALRGRYDMVNIKLDKAGGLTEALTTLEAARSAGFLVMVGCMVASSLAIAPAILIAQGADVVDLDGSLLLAEDREPPLDFDDAGLHPADPALWG